MLGEYCFKEAYSLSRRNVDKAGLPRSGRNEVLEIEAEDMDDKQLKNLKIINILTESAMANLIKCFKC